VICLSRIDDFLLHHLPNQYLGRYGLLFEDMHAQVQRIIELADEQGLCSVIPDGTGLDAWQFEKPYYGKADESVLQLVPDHARRVLSVGTTEAETERALQETGRTVDAIPLDPYVAVFAERKGLHCLDATWQALMEMPPEHRYDLVLLSDLLSYAEDPVALLRICRKHVSAQGYVLLNSINADALAIRKMIPRCGTGSHGYTFCTRQGMKTWLETAGWRVVGVKAPVNQRDRRLKCVLRSLLKHYFSSRLSILAQATPG
jgi:hypothetical protein